MTNEAASLLEQIAVLEMEIDTRALLRAMILAELAKHIESRKTECGFSPGSPSAEKWNELEKSASPGAVLAILDFLAGSKRTIPELTEAWELHGDLRLAIRVLARSAMDTTPRFNPTNN